MVEISLLTTRSLICRRTYFRNPSVSVLLENTAARWKIVRYVIRVEIFKNKLEIQRSVVVSRKLISDIRII